MGLHPDEGYKEERVPLHRDLDYWNFLLVERVHVPFLAQLDG